MREIRFKAVFKENNTVSTNSFTIDELAHYEEHEWNFSDGGSLPANDVAYGDLKYIQYTGLHDKNGKEIYEGDIVRYRKYMDEEIICTEEIKDIRYCPPIIQYSGDCEVIGNIYENPELVERGEK